MQEQAEASGRSGGDGLVNELAMTLEEEVVLVGAVTLAAVASMVRPKGPGSAGADLFLLALALPAGCYQQLAAPHLPGK